jgi:hypothetical protein
MITKDRLACMSSVPLRRRVVGVARDLGVGVGRPRAVMDEQNRAVAGRDFQQRPRCSGVHFP